MKALQIDRKLGRIGLARVLSAVAPATAAKAGPLELVRADPPALPGPEWVRLRPRLSGICGSDLATVQGQAGAYFDSIVSFPFTLGHELVADTVVGPGEPASRRVVLIPVLHCAIRGVDPVCAACAAGDINRCERVAFGHLKPGLQTGYCEATGGGWSEGLVAHPLQLVDVPDDLSDEDAVMIEPTACAARAAREHRGGTVAIIGAGTVGLLTLAAIIGRDDSDDAATGARSGAVPIIAAKYPAQRRFATELGATVCAPDELARIVRSQSASLIAGDQLTGGVAQVFDCVGTSRSLEQALSVVAPGGEVVMVGMPSTVTVDLTGLWHREVRITGCYAYRRDDFETAIGLVRRFGLGRMVSATYALDEYDDAIAHAADAGRRDAIKVAFDMRRT
jgi:threonine dehydrogenase-like Zn-dependent dehydrogenase